MASTASAALHLAALLPFLLLVVFHVSSTTSVFQLQPPAGTVPTAASSRRHHLTGTAEPQPSSLLSDVEALKRAGSASMDLVQRLDHLAKVLQLLGYKDMASAAPLMAGSQELAIWRGSLTVFAVPDSALALCSRCDRRLLMAQHMALSSYPYSEVSAARSLITLPAAKVNYCLNSTSSPTSFFIKSKSVAINGVDLVKPDLYMDDIFLVHGLNGYVTLPADGSCGGYEDKNPISESEALARLSEAIKNLEDMFRSLP